MVVMDDGWFGKRDDDNSGLGDWQVNEKKLGCTLALCGIAENCLRYRQCLPIFQRIMEQVTVQPHQRAGMPILVAFRLTQ